jgi:SAM-dependent methyltransferase
MECLKLCRVDLKRQSELRVAFEQWRRFLSIAYGRFDDSPNMFLVHTYLSVFAKFIAYAVIAKEAINDDFIIHEILTGRAFERLNIERFVADDFFHWTAGKKYFTRLQPMFRELNRQIREYDFSEVREDILKGVYQEFIDLDTKHALGEYFTPDWLCERVIKSLPVTRGATFLDPACGSGSFLRAIIARIKREFPETGAETIAEQVVGIDIHPLSVLIAKATVLLALGESVIEAKRPVTLHVYLANSLLVPRGTADLFQSSFKIAVDNKRYVLNVKGVEGAEAFDRLITFCQSIVNRYKNKEPIERERFGRLLKPILSNQAGMDLPGQLYDVYSGMKAAHSAGRDSIWKFILQNSYKPVFLMNRFDFVVGNPPWLTYAAVSNGEYQRLLRQLSDGYAVTPIARANMPHLEIAAIFLAHAVNYFLKATGQLVFVMPRSFLSADQHDNTRTGVIEGVKLTQVWDLEGVSPLFRVPSCTLFAVRSQDEQRQIPSVGIPGLTLSGRLPRAQIHWNEVEDKLSITPLRWFCSRLHGGRGMARSAFTTQSMEALVGSNAYASRFHQGATIVPRNFFFVDIDRPVRQGENVRDRIVALQTAAAAEREAHRPWKGEILTGRVEGSLLFRTAISRNVIPFLVIDPLLVVLPLAVEGDEDRRKRFKLLDAEGLLEEGFPYGSAWFFEAEKCWDRKKTDRNRQNKTGLSAYLNWQNKLTEQNPRARYLALYTSSATDASAAVIDRRDFDHPFVVDHKTYWCECGSDAEAHYIAAYLNSRYANNTIKEFQSRGLFGHRDIHKLIVKLPFPQFQKGNSDHDELSALGRSCTALAGDFVKVTKCEDLQPRALGSVRTRLREKLGSQMERIDELAENLSRGGSERYRTTTRKGRRSREVGRLFE